MRLLALCDYYSPDSCGGAERVAREIYGRLARQHGVEVTVVGTGPFGAYRELCSSPGIREVAVPGHDLARLVGVQLTVSARLGRVVRDVAGSMRPTVLHANSLHFQSTIAAAGLARRTGLPLVTTAHLGSTDLLPARVRLGAAAWDRVVGRYIVRSSDRVIAVSDSVARHMRSLGAAPRDIATVPNGVDHAVFHGRGRRKRSGPLRLGFVGRLIANKGPQVLVDALALVAAAGRDFEAEFIGDGPMRAQLEAHARRTGLGGRVTFTGRTDDVAAKLRGLDVVVRPSFTEGLPLAVIEAMACGAVVVCSDVPGNLELVDDASTGLVFPTGDASALARVLGHVIERPEMLDGIRDKAVARAEELSWDGAAHRYFEVLNAVAESGSQ